MTLNALQIKPVVVNSAGYILLRMESVLALLFAIVAGLSIGAYLSAYMKRKGKNLATREDTRLVDQVKAVTQTTKEIEAKISNDFWVQQRKWELRKS